MIHISEQFLQVIFYIAMTCGTCIGVAATCVVLFLAIRVVLDK